MSHPIQFRVWSQLESKWMDNIVLSAQGTPILLYSEKVDSRVFHRVYLIDNYQPLIQWSTGLKDKTGRLIYEGDILKYDDIEDIIIVDWDGGGFKTEWPDLAKKSGAVKMYLGEIRPSIAEVIDTVVERAARTQAPANQATPDSTPIVTS